MWRFRVCVKPDGREPAAALARITPVDSVVYTNMVYEGHQLCYYSRRAIIYANVDEDRLSNRHVYYLEFEGGTCQEKFSIRSIEEVKSSRVINSSRQLIYTAPCFMIYSVDSKLRGVK